ncbi:MAG: Stf0 family sulfotransferase [Marinibacterium sp.]
MSVGHVIVNQWRRLFHREVPVPRMTLFDPARDPNTKRGARLDGKPAPERSYIVLFTPRSGSSWLHDLIASCGDMGDPGEFFNPNFVPTIAERVDAPDIDTYLRRLTRLRCPGGTFGTKVTPDHAYHALGGLDAFLDRFPEAALFWLIREDIVAQAVSLYLMRFQEKHHKIDGEDPAAMRQPTYDADIIEGCMLRLFNMEETVERSLARTTRPVVRLSQERMLNSDRTALLALMRAHMGLPSPTGDLAATSRHKKIGTSINDDFACRFRQDKGAAIRRVSAAREPRLAAIRTAGDG